MRAELRSRRPTLICTAALTALALTPSARSSGSPPTAIDAGGLVPDDVDHNSWTQRVDEVDPVELLEVQLCNMTAPFILISRLRAALAASRARRTYVVNVSAMEGSSAAATRAPATRTRTWPRPR